MPTISLGFAFQDGDFVSPDRLHALIEQATVNGFQPSDFGSIKFWTLGPTRPTLERGAVHYDTTPGLEGLYYAWQSASNASISYWLCAMPRRECIGWAASAVSAGTPLFCGGQTINQKDFVLYDGCGFPLLTHFTGASGPDAAFFIPLANAAASSPVKCLWAGMLTTSLSLLNSGSGASTANPVFVDYAQPSDFKMGNPSARQQIFGINTIPGSGAGAIIWGAGPAIFDIA